MPDIRELDSRYTDGIYVIMAWNRRDGSVWITCMDEHDQANDLAFRVHDPSRAYEAFLHPYVFAAGREMETAQ